MKFYELSQMPFQERFKYANDLVSSDMILNPDKMIVNEIFSETIKWFQEPSKQSDPDLISKLANAQSALPSIFETIYGIKEKSIIEKLPREERQRIFDDSKEAWCQHYPEFRRISEIIEKFQSNDLLIEFRKRLPPSFIREKAIEIYKKCLSFKVKLKQSKVDNLGYSYTPSPLCINNKGIANLV